MKLLDKVKSKLKCFDSQQCVEVEMYLEGGCYSIVRVFVSHNDFNNQYGFKSDTFSVVFNHINQSPAEKLLAILEATPTPVIKGVMLPDYRSFEVDLSGEDIYGP